METVAQAVGLFAATNVDDLLLLAVFFTSGAAAWRVVAGQYLGFVAILAVSLLGAAGASLLPEDAIPWLGLLPIALGIYAWLRREDADGAAVAPGVLGVTVVTFANGGDNIGVYVPVFATGHVAVYVVTFLVLVAGCCVAARALARHPAVGGALDRWGHVIVPGVLIAIGVAIIVGA